MAKSLEDQFEQKLRSFVKAAMRRVSRNWPPRNEAFVAARVERGLYQCAMCKNSFRRDQLQLDHKVPVVDLKGKEYTIEQWIRGLLVPAEGWQCLCLTCHETKTLIENKIRAKNAQKVKKELTKAKKKDNIKE